VRIAAGGVVLGAVLIGCFDVEQVDTRASREPLPLRIIDDFEDDIDNSVRQPTDPAFAPWSCAGENGGRGVRCDTAQGFIGTGRSITFDLSDFADGKRDYQGVALTTLTLEPVDLSGYTRLGLSAALAPGEHLSTTATSVLVRLRCGGLVGGHYSETWVEPKVLPVRPDLSWYTFAPLIRSFHQPPYQKEEWIAAGRPPIDEAACISRVEAISIYVQPDAADGKRVNGTLTVDEIYVQ
jgi:hypothetical protein